MECFIAIGGHQLTKFRARDCRNNLLRRCFLDIERANPATQS
jgi:hypothetical protein